MYLFGWTPPPLEKVMDPIFREQMAGQPHPLRKMSGSAHDYTAGCTLYFATTSTTYDKFGGNYRSIHYINIDLAVFIFPL